MLPPRADCHGVRSVLKVNTKNKRWSLVGRTHFSGGRRLATDPAARKTLEERQSSMFER